MEDRDALLVLNAVPGLGPVRIKSLVEHFGSACGVLSADYEDILSVGIVTPAVTLNIVHFPKDKFLINEYNLLRQKNVTLLTIADEGYPQGLANIPGAPVVLYCWGDPGLLHSASVAIVGSRIASHYGLSVAGRFAASFAQAQVTVVSGMARGIDTAAHRGCLDSSGKTVAVLGCGLNHIYPKENSTLMKQIAEFGVVVSELPMATPPIPANFPRRNRIISGLSLVTVVIEAGLKSGAMITVDYALEQGKSVFAVPANIDYITAQGSNKLIKDGAKVALDPSDVLDEFKSQLHLEFPDTVKKNIDAVSLDEIEARYYKHLTLDPIHIDDLAIRSKSMPGEAMQVMLNLELRGIIRQLPGKYYVKI